MANLNDLKEFIDSAEKSRKYAKLTAQGRRVALKLFEAELSTEEIDSLDLFNDRFDAIYNSVFQNNKKNMNASSILTYRKRVRALLNDYRKYGNNPSAFTGWDVTRNVNASSRSSSSHQSTARIKSLPINAELVTNSISDYDETIMNQIMSATQALNSEVNRMDVFIRPGFKVSLILPTDLSKSEANRLKHIIDGMVSGDGEVRL